MPNMPRRYHRRMKARLDHPRRSELLSPFRYLVAHGPTTS
jgi:hypothetical protein